MAPSMKRPCVAPAYDTCAGPALDRSERPDSLSLAATAFDYPTECAASGRTSRDVVVALKVPKGAARDIDVVAQCHASQVSLATAAVCGDAASTVCSASRRQGKRQPFAAALIRPSSRIIRLIAAVAADQETNVVELSVKFSAASSAPANERAAPLPSSRRASR